jgi:hypothetical protein
MRTNVIFICPSSTCVLNEIACFHETKPEDKIPLKFTTYLFVPCTKLMKKYLSCLPISLSVLPFARLSAPRCFLPFKLLNGFRRSMELERILKVVGQI